MEETAILYKEFLDWARKENEPGLKEWTSWENEKMAINRKRDSDWMKDNDKRDEERIAIIKKQNEWDEQPFWKKLFGKGRPVVPMSLYRPNYLAPPLPFSLYIPKHALTVENFMHWLIEHKYKL